MAEKIARVIFGGRGRIEWKPTACEQAAGLMRLATPAASLLSAGFAGVAAGVGIYNAFQLKRQEAILDKLGEEWRESSQRQERMLEEIKDQLQLLRDKTDRLLQLTEDIRADVRFVKDLSTVQNYITGPLNHFAAMVTSPCAVDFAHQVDVLHQDLSVAYTLLVRKPLRTGTLRKDATIPAFVVDQCAPQILMLNSFNLFLLDVHNNRDGVDARRVRSYYSLEEGHVPAGLQALCELQQDYYRAASRDRRGRPKKKKVRALPAAQVLIALMWEIEHLKYVLGETKVMEEPFELQVSMPKALAA